ncbi:MAG TPA: hypothetical protein VNH11_09055 [Pirellulales bacterium]|nr:hypothetical protein [Pirellulales bacterium]
MPRLPIDLARKIKDVLQHVQPLPDEAKAPILHYWRTGADTWVSLAYLERAVRDGERRPSVGSRHLGRLYGMVLVNLASTFERFLKEIAAECVDVLADFIVDDRFNVFAIQGSAIASHFGAATLGKSLCESSTWLDCEEINKRFRRLLSDPFQIGGKSFDLFPKQSQQPAEHQWRFEPMNLIWQIRHTAVHNVGVITNSDAVKMRLWTKENVDAPQILAPTRRDLNHLKRFLDDTANVCNARIGERLAELLTAVYTPTDSFATPQQLADRVAAVFRLPMQIAGAKGIVPSD